MRTGKPGRPPSGPSGRRSAGEGSEGRPRPGRGHAQAPRVTRGRPGARGGCAGGPRIPVPPRPHSESRSAQDSAAAAGHPLPLPGPRGQRQLVIVRAQRAGRQGGRPSPSASSVEASPARHTLRLRSPERDAEGRLPLPRPSPCYRDPAPQDESGAEARAGPAPHPQRLVEEYLDLRRRRHLAAHSIGKVRSGAGMCGRLEFRYLRVPTTHPAPPAPPLQLPPSSCSSAGTSSPQIRRLPASSGLRTPGARLAGPGGAGRGGAAEAAPPAQEGSGLPSTPSTADPVSSPAVAQRWPEAAPLASDFTAF
ncbi:collagen alpha-1(I) chain-like [Panthera leo]|uniref:collagen alpha-1(I) chain-like n=1 Tax=Panthera leo TaxID=9689 RepID=UPI001C69E4D0|nr:collagen alpha-1(I) chain-like [Panthera leo]